MNQSIVPSPTTWRSVVPRPLRWMFTGLAAFIIGAATMGPDVWGLAGVLTILAGYFLPTIVGSTRKHHNASSIFVVNLFLGWTLIGWVVALAMATSAVRTNRPLRGSEP